MKHEFSLFHQSTSQIAHAILPEAIFSIAEPGLITRIGSVLRMRVNDSFILFDRNIHIVCQIQEMSKKIVRCTLLAKKQNTILHPHVTFLLPVLKRDDLEMALYAMVELGASSVQLIITDNINRVWIDKEFERAQRIMIAAAEQSKNYAIPQLHKPLLLSSYVNTLSKESSKIFFDVDGKSAFSVMKEMQAIKPQNMYLLVGPEADLTVEEKKVLIAQDFIFCQLTPTILRAFQAATVGLGIIRSVMR